MANFDILRVPDRVTAFCEGGVYELHEAAADGNWAAEDVTVVTQPSGGTLPVKLSAPRSAVKRLRLRWNLPKHGMKHLLGDRWEHGYGDLEWRSLVAERPLPWYFLALDGARTHGVGVKLGERILDAATVIVRDGIDGETPFQAAQAFCRVLCDVPLMPKQPVYGATTGIMPMEPVPTHRF